MKLSVLSENLNRALGIASRVVTARAQLPILANVLLRATKEGLEVLATDLEMGVRVKVGAKVEVEGELSVSARTLSEYAATLGTGVVELLVDQEVLHLKMGRSSAKFPGITAQEFPVIPAFKGKTDVEMEMKDLIEIVEKVGFSASKDESRPIFTGMLWKFLENKLTVVATDGYRLSVDDVKVEKVSEKEIRDLVLPVKALQEVIRGADKAEKKVLVVVDEDKQQVIFKIGEIEWVSRLLAGDFPPYQQIMPTNYVTKTVVGRNELSEAVKRAVIFARESANIIKLVVDEGKILVSANSAQVGGGETEVEVETEGDSLTVAFNGKYLLDYLAVMDADEVIFENAGPLKAGVFKVAGKKMTHVIMPVRVQV